MRKLTKLLVIALLLGGCTNGGIDGTAQLQNFSGTLYWNFAGDFNSLELNSGKYTKINNLAWLRNFDITRDNQEIFMVQQIDSDIHGTYKGSEYTLRRLSHFDKTQINSKGNDLFTYTIEWDDTMMYFAEATISPNKRFFAINTYDASDVPMMLVDITQRKIILTLDLKEQGIGYTEYGDPIWTADNTLFFRVRDMIFKLIPSDNYTNLIKVGNLPQGAEQWAINPQGTQIAFRKQHHIWISDIDGNNAQQITQSITDPSEYARVNGEYNPTFSPDGKHIAFGGNAVFAANTVGDYIGSSGFQYIYIIPNDGKSYDLDNENSGHTKLLEDGKKTGRAVSGKIIWR